MVSIAARVRRLIAGLGGVALALATLPAPAQTPSVSLHFDGNRSFLRDDAGIRYLVVASDPQRGDSLAGGIEPHQVAVRWEHAAPGQALDDPQAVDPNRILGATVGRPLIEQSGCVLCHQHESAGKTAVPSYAAIAERYQGNPAVAPALAMRIREGGIGVWGQLAMPAHRSIGEDQALAMAHYILSVQPDQPAIQWLPLLGSLEIPAQVSPADGPFGPMIDGRFLLSASYTAQNGETHGVRRALYYHNVPATSWERGPGVRIESVDDDWPALLVAESTDSWMALRDIDLSTVTGISLTTAGSKRRWPGGRLQLRLGDPRDGRSLGEFLVTHDGSDIDIRQTTHAIGVIDGLHDLYLVFDGGSPTAVGAVRFLQ